MTYYLCSSFEGERPGDLKMKKETKESGAAAGFGAAESAQVASGRSGVAIPGRRRFLQASLLGGAAAAAGPVLQPAFGVSRGKAAAAEAADVPAFELDEITIGELQDGMKSGKFTARSIAEKYLARIAAIDKSGPMVSQRH